MRQRLIALLLALNAYSYAGYPLLLLSLVAIRTKPVRKTTDEPSVSLIVPAFNEAGILARKLDSILSQGYPEAKLEIIVASDGSEDATNDIARSYAERGVRLLALERRGKVHALNAAAAEARFEILAFSDANAILAPGALRALVANFGDSAVGGVSANEQRDDAAAAGAAGLGERLYWEYDKRIKQAESAVGSMVSASGSLYAIRRSVFRPVADAAVTDDFVISTRAVEAGLRLVFEPESITYEPVVASGEVEFGRKVRIVTGGWQSIYTVRALLLPWRSGFYSVELLSHKILRRLTGVSALAIFGLSLTIRGRNAYRLFVAGQLLFYLLAVLGWVGQRKRWGRRPWFFVPYYFCLSNVAATLGLLRFISQRRIETWQTRRDT